MNKILLIIKREYITRVRKKSFIVMSILGPLLIIGFYGIIIWASISEGEHKEIAVLDESNLFEDAFDQENSAFSFVKIEGGLEAGKESLNNGYIDGILYIPASFTEKNTDGVLLFESKGLGAKAVSDLQRNLLSRVRDLRLPQLGVTQAQLNKLEERIPIRTISLTETGEESDSNVAISSVVGIVGGLIIYFFVFMYSTMVMKGVLEEKTSRVVEVIVSSVKPFQLMLGKIIGVGAVGLTQLLLWIILGAISVTVLANFVEIPYEQIQEAKVAQMQPVGQPQLEVDGLSKVYYMMHNFDFIGTILAFIYYFIFAYLMYSSLFAAIGASVDNETDSQQFMLPVTMPLILAIALSGGIVSDPQGSLAFWLSIIPLTSPVVMMIRLPFIGFGYEVILSMVLLFVGFLTALWVAGRIYRIGLLTYGKKPTYGEIFKWMFRKD
ncbi:ABC transporter permease [Flammeovirga kamogawensis]|uniref:ABC transporter permease n=1 Tax=Flammeovirga kamogawensis TaxID=373891 RepID=A0ABX8GYG6_9BACT|nr:ABC transporter permease [Flammeovirga kamogawensis]MBB6459096.1 ABC-2 type transport system permease protein [Flammeovirga kamogawensis]QWG08665.1 ABC transporter permease [Flammeovirga kamogawensis]TRX66958.1 ABC transporter permease [Flammeovirga kamogawensis]